MIAIRVHDSRWRDEVRWNPGRTGEQAFLPIIDDRDRAYDVILEVLDQVRGALLASRRFDMGWAAFAGPGQLMVVKERLNGFYEVDIRRVHLTGR